MVTLPTIEVTDEQYAAIMDAFEGDTQADKDAAYLEWHSGQMVHYIQRVAYLRAEIAALEAEANVASEAVTAFE